MLMVTDLIGCGNLLLNEWKGDFRNATSAGISKNLSAQDTQQFAVFMSPDGIYFYMFGSQYNKIYRYTLSTPFNISTATNSQTTASAVTTMASVGYFYGMDMSSDGTKIYMCGTATGLGGGRVSEFTLSTAWDLSTISHTYTKNIESEVPSNRNSLGFSISRDGTKFYVAGADSGGTAKIFQYSMPAFSLASCGYATQYSPGFGSYCCKISHDGRKFYATQEPSSIKQYILSTPYDISTASLDYTYSTGRIYGIGFNDDGTKTYLMDWDSDTVSQYTII